MTAKLEGLRDLGSQNSPITVRTLLYKQSLLFPRAHADHLFPRSPDSAASAVRNLNDHEIMGRKLRVDFSNETVSDDDGGRDRDSGVWHQQLN